jgi:chemotaxis protein MotB
MERQSNVAPVIIKRKKVIKGGGHHGGAWKVAYADFVTAMMAFFMLMWLLNATTDKQRKGIADYFNPTIAIARVSAGGDGVLGGDSSFSADELTETGIGATDIKPTESDKARGDVGTGESEAAAAEKKAFEAVDKALKAQGGESMTMTRLLKHVVSKVTEEGLVVEIFDLPDAPLFEGETAVPLEQTKQIAAVISEVFTIAENQIAIGGFVRTLPITLKNNQNWDLSTARAQAMRELLEASSTPAAKISRISGNADRKPIVMNPAAIRNNRIEVVLLRTNR